MNKLATRLAVLGRAINGPACDALGLAGFVLIMAGVDMLSRPAALIVGGGFAFAAAWRWARVS